MAGCLNTKMYQLFQTITPTFHGTCPVYLPTNLPYKSTIHGSVNMPGKSHGWYGSWFGIYSSICFEIFRPRQEWDESTSSEDGEVVSRVCFGVRVSRFSLRGFLGLGFGGIRDTLKSSIVFFLAIFERGDPNSILYTTYSYVCNLSIATFMNFQNSQKPGFCNLTYIIKVISFNLCFSWSDRLMAYIYIYVLGKL